MNMANRELNRLKVVLAEKKKTNKWLGAPLVGGTPRALADGGQIASCVNRDSMAFDADPMSVRLKPMP